VLLASCSSQQAAAWVLAVPAVLQQLQQQAFQLGGAAEAHGALWELVISKSSSSSSRTAVHAAQTGSGSSTAQCGQLLELLALDCSNVSNLQRQVALLQLLADVQQAAGSRQQLWGPEVVAALKQVAARIKSLQAGTAGADGAAGTERLQQGVRSSANGDAADKVSPTIGMKAASDTGPGGSSSSSSSNEGRSIDDDAEGKGAKAVLRLQQQLSGDAGGDDVDALRQRQRQQLQPAALKLIKKLLTSGGKTD
jgi:hypothetical protein